MSRPRPTLFEVHHSNFTKNGCTWYINGYPQGKRLQFWFKTEKEAKKSANERNAEITLPEPKINFRLPCGLPL
jgi:hypothetical protein